MPLSLEQILAISQEKALACGNVQLDLMIQRELFHYDILDSLLDEPTKNALVFQGGTALRLCYDSPRLSEDLDFCVGSKFEFLPSLDISARLETALARCYGPGASLKRPNIAFNDLSPGESVQIAKWFARFDMSPARPDLKKQKVKIEIASVPAHSSVILPIRSKYEDVTGIGPNLTLQVETLDEILADKLFSYAVSSYVRWRDIWDLGYILRQNGFQENSLELLAAKAEDYFVPLPKLGEKIEQQIQTLPNLVESGAFSSKMHDLLPAPIFNETLAVPNFRKSLSSSLRAVYRQAEEYLHSYGGDSSASHTHKVLSKADKMLEKAKDEAFQPSPVPIAKRVVNLRSQDRKLNH